MNKYSCVLKIHGLPCLHQPEGRVVSTTQPGAKIHGSEAYLSDANVLTVLTILRDGHLFIINTHTCRQRGRKNPLRPGDVEEGKPRSPESPDRSACFNTKLIQFFWMIWGTTHLRKPPYRSWWMLQIGTVLVPTIGI